MLKPLSEKTLIKKYQEAGLNQEQQDTLHKYFNIFSNLYGLISLPEAWDIFREYEGLGLVHKNEFYAFAAIAQREEHSYSICDIKEIFDGADSGSDEDKLIVNNFLISSGYNKFWRTWCLNENQADSPWYMPADDEIADYENDQLFETPFGARLKKYIENLKSAGVGGLKATKGVRLSDLFVITKDEQDELDMEKRENYRNKLLEEFSCSASEKLLCEIRFQMMVGSPDRKPVDLLNILIRTIVEDFGVHMNNDDMDSFIALYKDVFNKSKLWQNRGWSFEDIMMMNKLS